MFCLCTVKDCVLFEDVNALFSNVSLKHGNTKNRESFKIFIINKNLKMNTVVIGEKVKQKR